jgi:hypothetical protein
MRVTLFAIFLQPFVGLGAIFGPICQWHQDPSTTMSVHWIERLEETPQKWTSETGPFRSEPQEPVLLRRPLQIPKTVSKGATLVIESPKNTTITVDIDGQRIETIPGRKKAVSLLNNSQKPHKPILLAVSLLKTSKIASKTIPAPRVFIQDQEEIIVLSDAKSLWNRSLTSTPNSDWNRIPPVPGILQIDRDFIFAYRKIGHPQWKEARISKRLFGPTDDWVHSVQLSKLNADSSYEFEILDHGVQVGQNLFKTAPLIFPNKMVFVTGGDMFHTRQMLDSMNRRAGTENPLFALLGGDLAYANGSDGDRWLEWVESWNKCATTPYGYSIPMIPVIGNHEVKGASYRPNDAPTKEAAPFFYSLFFGMEKGSMFTVDFGDYLSVIALDSGHTQNIKSQTPWLRETLHARRSFPFKFACYHRPAWGTGVKGDSLEIQKEWCPLFEEYHVDAAFENDHHIYKRTYPLKGGERDDSEGVVYLGDGAWGTRTRGLSKEVFKTRPFLAHAESRNHLIKVSLKKGTIRYEAITASGERFDVFDRTSGEEAQR